jgi:Flp pilus assembly protein TadG
MRAPGTKRGLLRGERGQALAEFALVLPLILLFISGVVEMGRAWNVKQAVTDAAREGARYSVVNDDDVKTMAQVQAKVEERLGLAGITQSDIEFSSADCAAVADCWHQSEKEMTVSVSTQFQMALMGRLLGWAGAPAAVTISTTATMRNEGGAAPPAP